MSTLEDVKTAIQILRESGCPKVTILQCTSQYPAPIDTLNLNTLDSFKELLTSVDMLGFSDHSLGYEAALVALGKGASVFEKHFTSDKALPGVDQKASASPEELTKYISMIKTYSYSLGDRKKVIGQEENKNYQSMRKSYFIRRDVKKGDRLSDEHIIALRPATGILSDKYAELIADTYTIIETI